MWLLILVALLILGVALVGLVVSAIVAVAYVVVAYLIPIVLIVAGCWLLARVLGGSDDHQRARRDARSQRRGPCRPAATPATSRPVHQHPVEWRPASPPRRELPVDVQVKAEQIRHKVDVLLGYADRFSPFSQDLYLVRQIAADYLPRTIAAYLAVPGVNDPLVGATGRTALEELREQLRILDARLDDITLNLQRQDIDGLLANRRFLEERFGLHDDVAPISPVRLDADAAGWGAAKRSA
jgi:hypothetical protein